MKTRHDIGDILTFTKNNTQQYCYVYDLTAKFTPKVRPLLLDDNGDYITSKYDKTLHWSSKNNAWQIYGFPVSKTEEIITFRYYRE